MLKWSIATACMGGELDMKLVAAAKAGFQAIDIFEADLTSFNGTPRDIANMAADLGVEIVALQPLRDFEAMPKSIRSKRFDCAKRKFDVMDELGTKLLCLCSNVSEEAIDDPDIAAADLAELADLAWQHGVKIGYEALSWGRHVRDWTKAWDIIQKADRLNLGIVLDNFHVCIRSNPMEPLAQLPPDKIAFVQISDAPALNMDSLNLSRHHRCYPGQGALPVDMFLDVVTRSGYQGLISLEIFNDQFRAAWATEVAIGGMRSLQTCAERLAAGRARRGDLPLRGIVTSTIAQAGLADRHETLSAPELRAT